MTLSPGREFSEEIKLLGGAKIDESGGRIAGNLIVTKERLNFNINIQPDTIIGERVQIAPCVSIGKSTQIGDHVSILGGVTIGQRCVVGKGVYLNYDCSIGNGTIIENFTHFMPKTNVPADSKVTHESADSSMAKIERKLEVFRHQV